MASLHQRPFSAAGVGSLIYTEVGMPGRAEPSGLKFLENRLREIGSSSKQK